jgi:hypothetical protein|tara:strand:- start:1079 stop:1312 length:234 start_codon:yes stop_codon:yes gene_type:complete
MKAISAKERKQWLNQKQLKELEKLLGTHDFYYMYSEDSKVFDSGYKSSEAIEALLFQMKDKSTKQQGKQMYQDYLLK